MGYCGQCGTELPASGKYCIKCGKPFTSAPQVEGGGQRKRSSQGNLEACILAAVAVYAVAAILGLLVGEIIGIIISVLLCVTLGFAYQKLGHPTRRACPDCLCGRSSRTGRASPC